MQYMPRTHYISHNSHSFEQQLPLLSPNASLLISSRAFSTPSPWAATWLGVLQ